MDIFTFLNESYTAYHAVKNICDLLTKNGFERLDVGEKWSLKEGGRYFTTQNGSSVVAFKVGKNRVFNICESHTDSPCLKIKGDKVADGDIKRLNTEKYGSALLYSFFDRPLKVAGRLFVQDDGVKEQLVASSYNVVIPSLAIHHNPTANDGFAVNAQRDLPIFSQSEKSVYQTLTRQKVLDGDLYVVPDSKAFVAGAKGEFLCSPRLDNLLSVYCCINALLQCQTDNIAIAACLDNEETGSGTRQGSPIFLQTVVEKVQHSLQMDRDEVSRSQRDGMVLSVDNGHANHPSYAEKSDVANVVKLNGGVVIKHNPNYATDGLTSALVKNILTKGNVPFQDYYNRSDVRCGSTLGLATSRTLQMKTCDIGCAQLAMHSACETVGVEDVENMQKCITLFLQADFSSKTLQDGEK